MYSQNKILPEVETADEFPCYTLVLDFDGVVVSMNSRLCAELGYAASELPETLKLTDLLTAGSRIFYQTHFFPLIKLHGSYNELFLGFKTREGEEVPVLLNARIMNPGNPDKILCAGLRMSRRQQYESEIIEARKKAEKALEDNARLKALQSELEKSYEELELRLRRTEAHSVEQAQINSIVSHELQEPLRKISLFSKMMLDQGERTLPQNWGSFLSKIHHSSGKIRDMIFSIQKYLSLGEKVLSPQHINLHEFVARVIGNNQGLVANASVKYRVAADTPDLIADPALLEDLFKELFSNSVKFANTSRRLIIDIEVEAGEENFYRKIGDKYKYLPHIRIRFSDNGAGFPPRYSEEVFGLFKKVHLFDEGLGFGLAFCHKIVELHHGSIEAQSEVNCGTTILLMLPATGAGNQLR